MSQSKLSFIQNYFPNGKRRGNQYAEIVCPQCNNKALAYYVTNENYPFGCKACGYSGNVYTLGYKNDPYQINEQNFDKELEKFKSHNNGQNRHRLSRCVTDIFDIQYKEIRSERGKTWPALGIWNGQELERWLGFNKDSQKYQWFAPSSKVYGSRNNPFLFTNLIDKQLDKVFVCAGEWDAFGFYEATQIIPLSTRNGESTRIRKPEHADYFSNKEVIILWDNDKQGRNGAFNFACDILRFVKSKVKIVDLSEIVERGGQDIDDYFNKHKGTKEELFKIIENTNYFTPPELSDKVKVLNHPNPDANPDTLIRYAIKKEYDVRYNTIKNLIEFKQNGAKTFKRIDDRKINDILLSLREYEELEKITKARFNENFYSSFMGDYNPFISYFDGLEKFDGKDYIKELSGYIKTDASCETYKEEYLKFWLVGCVAQCFPDDEYNLRKKYGQHGKNQYCLIFQGKQQKGKTEFFEFLASSIGHEYFYSGDVDAKNKDSIISVAENFIVHLDELSDKIRYYKTLEQYKSLVAGAQTINVRKPYDREHLLLKRHASFCASINDAHGLLKDLTGARRWMILTGVDIDRKLYDNIDLNKPWAQAFSLYLSGFKHWYDDPEILNIRNEEYRGHGIEEELILDGIADNVFSVGKRYTASQVLKELNKKYEHSKNLSHVSIGKVCNKLFRRTRTNGRSEYTIIEQTQEKIEEFNEDEIF